MTVSFTDQSLRIRGARQHNLKNIDLDLPHGRFIIVTGPSGSGKSSLVFDTIFAEGQRRYVESLSTYARQFLERLPRPDVDLIEGVTPTIAIEQKNPVQTSRSTVGTATEILDYLRLLFARIGEIYCPSCNRQIIQDTPDVVVDSLVERYAGQPVLILAPLDVRGLKTTAEKRNFIQRLLIRGWTRCYKKGEVARISEEEMPAGVSFYLAVDQVLVVEEERHRLTEAIEQAYEESGGKLQIKVGGEIQKYSLEWRCSDCEGEFPALTPHLLSFNNPYGACPVCKGFGDTLEIDPQLVVPDPGLSLSEGAVEPWTKPGKRQLKNLMFREAEHRGIDIHKPYVDLTEDERGWLWQGGKRFPGIYGFFEKLEKKKYKLRNRVLLSRYKMPVPCGSCRRTRLRKEALSVKVRGAHLGELCEWNIESLETWLRKIRLSQFEQAVVGLVLDDIRKRVSFLLRVGLGYLALSRHTKTLSGGEFQRINIARQLGAGLVQTSYVLDEPTIGLHPKDNQQLIDQLKDLQERGNSLIVVEHDPQMIHAADEVVELGPGSGEKGGEVVFAGPYQKFAGGNSLTARWLRARETEEKEKGLKPASRPKRVLSYEGISHHNLKNINVRIPLHQFVCVTGVSGSGKSSLVEETIYNSLARLFYREMLSVGKFSVMRGAEHLKGAVLVDQSPVGKSPRSNPMTYIKGFDEIRKILAGTPDAKAKGWGPSFFSFNVSGGRCDRCEGQGFEIIEMQFLADIQLPCEECGGKRYRSETLDLRWKGKNVDEILNLTFQDALAFFSSASESLKRKLSLMNEVGLGYLRLGQPATTLSGGESQRLKIARELCEGGAKEVLYVMDEPTTGLHLQEVALLLRIIRHLVVMGNTVLVIEHNLDVIKSCDYVIDLGPE
ncbi:MAG: excinuclease ABC subunit UvrA, partial [Deltaproteobacteria bacterium]|nr:excinuclease ABC subunit UvrA [Deltaproteobacteria bacterium]